jgi:hypothetical protein
MAICDVEAYNVLICVTLRSMEPLGGCSCKSKAARNLSDNLTDFRHYHLNLEAKTSFKDRCPTATLLRPLTEALIEGITFILPVGSIATGEHQSLHQIMFVLSQHALCDAIKQPYQQLLRTHAPCLRHARCI